jgi:hypothetical protein
MKWYEVIINFVTSGKVTCAIPCGFNNKLTKPLYMTDVNNFCTN